MDSWNAHLELTKARIAEIEDKIDRQRQMAERLQNDNSSPTIALISASPVMMRMVPLLEPVGCMLDVL